MNSLIVILYNKEMNDSETLKTLIKSDYVGDLYIVNNGPEKFKSNNSNFINLLIGRFDNINIHEDVENRPLSRIYNDFINSYDYENYFIFDDDTEIPSNFFYKKEYVVANISLPIICSKVDGVIYYPMVNGKVFNKPINEDDRLLSIASGLMINNSLKKIFKKYNIELFDNRFALYGVDFSLFRRIDRLRNKYREKIIFDISGVLSHSLSRLDLSSFSRTRKNERLIDIVLSRIYYPGHSLLYSILYILKESIVFGLRCDWVSSYIVLRTLLRRKHPRC